MSHKVHDIAGQKLYILQQFTADIHAVGHARTAAVIPRHHDIADIVHAVHGALRADGRRLGIVHLYKLDPCPRGKLFTKLRKTLV